VVVVVELVMVRAVQVGLEQALDTQYHQQHLILLQSDQVVLQVIFQIEAQMVLPLFLH
jgi:hypothetical protein